MAAEGLNPHREFSLFLSTAGSLQEARRLSQIILKKRLAGCINLIPHIESWYRWKGRDQQGKEVLLLIKSSCAHRKALCRLLKSHHSYEIPELISLPIPWGEQVYLNWLGENLKPVSRKGRGKRLDK